jgi:hypothetical protein
VRSGHVLLLGLGENHSRAWNCSGSERVFGNTSGFAEGETHWNNVRYLRSFGNRFPQAVLPPVTQSGSPIVGYLLGALQRGMNTGQVYAAATDRHTGR